MRNGDGKKLTLLFGLLGLAVAVLAVEESMQSTSSTPNGSLPDVPGLREREAAEPGFVAALLQVVNDTGADGDKLAALMSEESRFNPQARNPVSGTVGFMQWMPRYARQFTGFTADEIYAMSGIDQLEAVRNTILNAPGYKSDPPMQGWGSHVGAPDDTVIASQGDIAYAQNKGYDRGGKGYITAGDVRSAVYASLGPAASKPRIYPS